MFLPIVLGVISAFVALVGAQMRLGKHVVGNKPDGTPYSQDVAQSAEKGTRKLGQRMLIAGLIGLVAAIGWGLAHDPSERAAESAERNAREQCESLTGANLMAREFVRDRLTAPSKAKFAHYRDSSVVTTMGRCEFRVRSYVDAQNAFGATVRTEYTAVIKYVPAADRWQIVSLDM